MGRCSSTGVKHDWRFRYDWSGGVYKGGGLTSMKYNASVSLRVHQHFPIHSRAIETNNTKSTNLWETSWVTKGSDRKSTEHNVTLIAQRSPILSQLKHQKKIQQQETQSNNKTMTAQSSGTGETQRRNWTNTKGTAQTLTRMYFQEKDENYKQKKNRKGRAWDWASKLLWLYKKPRKGGNMDHIKWFVLTSEVYLILKGSMSTYMAVLIKLWLHVNQFDYRRRWQSYLYLDTNVMHVTWKQSKV